MAVLDFDKSVWENALGDALDAVPDALILEGTWWRSSACKRRLGYLTDVVELPFPDMFIGKYDGVNIAYCCAYGAARAVEPAHIFAQLGTPLLVQIGTCGVMTSDIPAGTVIVPRQAEAREAISPYYGAGKSVSFDAGSSNRTEEILQELGASTRDARHMTWTSLFAQSDEICRGWAEEGLESVDMEASVVAAVAAKFDRACVALLSAWDELSEGQTFLDPLPEDRQRALDHANRVTFESALRLATEV